MKTEVFISYARQDKLLARQIYDFLKSSGLEVWWDQDVPERSNDFRPDIEKKLSESQSTLLLWTERAARKDSTWLRWEAGYAMADDKLVLLNIDKEYPTESPLKFCKGIGIELEDGDVKLEDLKTIRNTVRQTIGLRGPKDRIVHPLRYGNDLSSDDLALEGPVPGTAIFVSFRPCDGSGEFLVMQAPSTSGWVEKTKPGKRGVLDVEKRYAAWKTRCKWSLDPSNDEFGRHRSIRDDELEKQIYITTDGEYDDILKVEGLDDEMHTYFRVDNDIIFIRDPIRPFGIQIGDLRSSRPSNRPGTIVAKIEDDAELHDLCTRYEWMAIMLADTLTDASSLDHLYGYVRGSKRLALEEKKSILSIVGRNPYAPIALQKKMCPFCRHEFVAKRRLSNDKQEEKYGAFIFSNDYPFGPHFHYLVAVHSPQSAIPIHSWEKMEISHFVGMNLLTHEFLSEVKRLGDSAGIAVGFNSTVRHIVLGQSTHSSAGASIPHIHKQVWGMSAKSWNLAEQLIQVCDAYENLGIDYLLRYQKALDEAGYVIWQDEHVMLYVPYGQCSRSELQVMTINPVAHFLELSCEQVISLSIAEYVVRTIYKELEDITSFNHVMLAKLGSDQDTCKF